MKTAALILFILMYVGMISFSKYRPHIAAGTAILFLILGVEPLDHVLGSVNWNVLMMLAGTMGTVALFIESRMPNRMADKLLTMTPNVMWAAVIMSLFSGFVSAFMDNVATVLMIAPVGLAVASRLGISPIPLLICISVSSNLQGAATLVGDTTSIMLGGYANMSFTDFIFMNGKFSIFWAVELGALATVPFVMWIFRKNREKIQGITLTECQDFFPTYLLIANILLLIGASFIQDKPEITNGLICMACCVVGTVRHVAKGKGFRTILDGIDLGTLLLLTGLFIVIDGISQIGIIQDISDLFVRYGGSSKFLMYTLITFGSVIFSAFIDNIPYVATMLPIVQSAALSMGWDPTVLYFGLLCGATLGGNLTPVGASANIVTIGILRKGGYQVRNRDFLSIGIPFTLLAVVTGYVFCWLVWA